MKKSNSKSRLSALRQAAAQAWKVEAKAWAKAEAKVMALTKARKEWEKAEGEWVKAEAKAKAKAMKHEKVQREIECGNQGTGKSGEGMEGGDEDG